jgi:hypothetical protein
VRWGEGGKGGRGEGGGAYFLCPSVRPSGPYGRSPLDAESARAPLQLSPSDRLSPSTSRPLDTGDCPAFRNQPIHALIPLAHAVQSFPQLTLWLTSDSDALLPPQARRGLSAKKKKKKKTISNGPLSIMYTLSFSSPLSTVAYPIPPSATLYYSTQNVLSHVIQVSYLHHHHLILPPTINLSISNTLKQAGQPVPYSLSFFGTRDAGPQSSHSLISTGSRRHRSEPPCRIRKTSLDH